MILRQLGEINVPDFQWCIWIFVKCCAEYYFAMMSLNDFQDLKKTVINLEIHLDCTMWNLVKISGWVGDGNEKSYSAITIKLVSFNESMENIMDCIQAHVL